MESVEAGAEAPFVMHLTRDDRQPEMRSLALTMPPGVLARIASATLCPDSRASDGRCPEESRIGAVTVGAGAGSVPFYLSGDVYVTEPYRDGQFGLSIVVPAIAGPFDLGTVVVRAAIYVDRRTTQLRVVTDPIPDIVLGVPLRLRAISVLIDRQGFMRNPTNCTLREISGEIVSYDGDAARRSERFAVANCAALSYRPRMVLRVGSRDRAPRRLRTVRFETVLSMPSGGANNRVVDVTLPKTLNARVEVVNVRNACSLEQYAEERCPISVGTARAVTPLLREPLVGRVFLVRNPARRLPDMMVRLKGQGDARLVEVDLVGFITIRRDLTVRTRFASVPDVPIREFRLSLVSGRNAPVAAVRPLCEPRFRRQTVARLGFTAQNGKRISRNQPIQVLGCSARRVKRATARKAAGKRAAGKHPKRAHRHR
jgi:hypothetical protein